MLGGSAAPEWVESPTGLLALAGRASEKLMVLQVAI